MNWETVASPIIQGGLELMYPGDMNKTFEAKWIYRFANNKEAMWRKVVCARSKGDSTSLWSTLWNKGSVLVFWGFVELALGRIGHASEIINQ